MTTNNVDQARARSFGPVARLYDQVRPGYPGAAVAWALAPLGPGRALVADVGAGTGIMTRTLVTEGHRVVAVEPDNLMRRRLTERSPQISVLDGQAEALPLPDAGVDAAVAAQSYHWFDRSAAHRELARVIRPGGVFAAIWNDRDESVAWLAEYTMIISGERGPARSGAAAGPDSFGDGFGPVEVRRFHHSVEHTPQTLVALLRSRSYYRCATPSHRRQLTDQVRVLAATHPQLAGHETFSLPYITSVYRANRS